MDKLARFLPLLLLAVLALAFSVRLLQTLAPETGFPAHHDPMQGKAMPVVELPPLYAGDAPLDTGKLEGKAYLLNIFASWCAACIIEHDQLKALKEQTGLPLYGMVWKDTPEKAQAWLKRMGNMYDAIGMDATSAAAIELGLTGVPETYLVDENGVIIALYRGAINETIIKKRFLPALQTHSAQDTRP